MRDLTGRNLRRALVSALAGAGLHMAPAAAIDLLRSYELALINDGQLKVARARADSGREAVPQAISQLLPNVSFSLAYGQTEQDRSLADVTQPTARYPSHNYTLTLRQPLIRHYQFSQYDQAKAKVASADAQLDSDYQETALRVVGSYFDSLFARDSLTLILAQKASYEAQLRAAKLAFAAGSGTRTDIDDIQTKYDLLLADEIQVRQAIVASTLKLQFFVGEPIDRLSTLDASSFRADGHDPGSLQAWVERALDYNADLRVLKARWDAAQSGIDMAKAGHLPTVDIVAQHAYIKGDANNVFPSTENRTNYIGVQLNVPIYSGGGVNSGVRESTARAEEARQTFEYARDDLRLKVRNQFDALKAGITRVHALERALVSTQQNVLSNQKGVLAGTRTILDVLNVEQQRFNTQVELAKGRYQLLVTWATLQSFVGELNAEQIARINRALQEPPPTTLSLH
jgi:outer membrane protein/protease secretion system outer membrane protein